jgi:hypothetical protein
VRIDASGKELLVEKPTELGRVTAELARVARRLDRGGILRQPPLQRGSEFEDREQKGYEDRDRERGLESRETAFVTQSFR